MDPSSEFGRALELHVNLINECYYSKQHNKDVRDAMCESFNQNAPRQEQLIRMKVPVPTCATFHVIHGPVTSPLSGATFIEYWNCYRPIVYWFKNETIEIIEIDD